MSTLDPRIYYSVCVKPRPFNFLIGHEGKYSTFSSKDKEKIHSLLFDALAIKQFDDKVRGEVRGLVEQLLGVGVPVTITDEVMLLYNVQ